MDSVSTEIQSVSFKQSMRGYSVEEVDKFIEWATIEVGKLEESLRGAKESANNAVSVQAPGLSDTEIAHLRSLASQTDRLNEELRVVSLERHKLEGQLSEAQESLRAATAKIQELEAKLSHFSDIPDPSVIARTLLIAQETASKLEQEAQAVLQEQLAKATEEVAIQKRKMLAELDELTKERERVHSETQASIRTTLQFANDLVQQLSNHLTQDGGVNLHSEEKPDAPTIEDVQLVQPQPTVETTSADGPGTEYNWDSFNQGSPVVPAVIEESPINTDLNNRDVIDPDVVVEPVATPEPTNSDWDSSYINTTLLSIEENAGPIRQDPITSGVDPIDFSWDELR